MNKRFIYMLILLVFLVPCRSPAGSLELRLNGGYLTLHADKVPLQEILKALAGQGVSVQIDPRLNPEISVSIENMDVEKGLKSFLKHLNYIIIWESVSGTSEIRLAEIQVFEPGKKFLMKPLRSRDTFAIARNPEDGSLFIQNEILLRLNPGISEAELKKLLKKIGGVIAEKNNAAGIYKIRLPKNSDIPDLVSKINKIPGVSGAEPNYAYPISLPYKNVTETPAFSGDYSSAPDGSIPIAVLDSGLIPDLGLDDLVPASLDAVNPENPISDSLGHGTQMALIASGIVKPVGIHDENRDSNPVIPIRAFDDNGVTSNFSIMRSIDFALENGARVLSLSWGSETKSAFLEQALDYADSKGLIVVASAGNEPSGKPVWPAAYPSVIGVGALGPDGKPWDKSNYGSFVTLSAPGFASLPVGYKGEAGAYAGTSISAAYVSNIIAQYLSENPDAKKDEILKNALKVEADK